MKFLTILCLILLSMSSLAVTPIEWTVKLTSDVSIGSNNPPASIHQMTYTSLPPLIQEQTSAILVEPTAKWTTQSVLEADEVSTTGGRVRLRIDNDYDVFVQNPKPSSSLVANATWTYKFTAQSDGVVRFWLYGGGDGSNTTTGGLTITPSMRIELFGAGLPRPTLEYDLGRFVNDKQFLEAPIQQAGIYTVRIHMLRGTSGRIGSFADWADLTAVYEVVDQGCVADVDFTMNPTVTYPYLPVQFNDLSTPAGSISSHYWRFGDQSVALLQQNPVHSYTEPGEYAVLLKITETAGCQQTEVKPAAVTVLDDPNATTGVWDGSTGTLYLSDDFKGQPATNQYSISGTSSTWTALSGDWDGDGLDTIGFFDAAAGEFHLINDHSTGAISVTVRYGALGQGLLPLVGDWNGDGLDTIGLYDSVNGNFFLRNSLTNGPADLTYGFGPDGLNWLPIAGDWNGDGSETVGLFDPVDSRFYMTDVHAPGQTDYSISFGPDNLGWKPLVGDWNGDGNDTIGLFDPANLRIYLRMVNSTGAADVHFAVSPSGSTWLPIGGDWDGL